MNAPGLMAEKSIMKFKRIIKKAAEWYFETSAEIYRQTIRRYNLNVTMNRDFSRVFFCFIEML